MVGEAVHISSASEDADLFLVVRVFDSAGEEITFQGALDPNTPISQGWLRASHRRTGPGGSRRTGRTGRTSTGAARRRARSTGSTSRSGRAASWCRPATSSRCQRPRQRLRVRGRAQRVREDVPLLEPGVGPYTHADPTFALPRSSAAPVTLFTGGEHDSHLLAPVIPAEPTSRPPDDVPRRRLGPGLPERRARARACCAGSTRASTSADGTVDGLLAGRDRRGRDPQHVPAHRRRDARGAVALPDRRPLRHRRRQRRRRARRAPPASTVTNVPDYCVEEVAAHTLGARPRARATDPAGRREGPRRGLGHRRASGPSGASRR